MNISPIPVLENYSNSKEAEVDSKIQLGLEQAEAGLGVPMDQKLIGDLQQELKEKIKARQKKT